MSQTTPGHLGIGDHDEWCIVVHPYNRLAIQLCGRLQAMSKSTMDKDDCISITDKTFDLSLDDPLSDVSSTAVDSLAEQQAITTTIGGADPVGDRHRLLLQKHQQSSKLQTILTDDISSHGGKPHTHIGTNHDRHDHQHRHQHQQANTFTDAQPRWINNTTVSKSAFEPIKQVNRTITSNIIPQKTASTIVDRTSTNTLKPHNHNQLVQKLKNSIHLLIHLSGNSINDASPEEMVDNDLDSLVEMVSKLTEASDYKMRFLTKNYSFLESVYDTTRRDLESTKTDISRYTEKVHDLKEELREQREKEMALRQQLQGKEELQRSMLGNNPSHNISSNNNLYSIQEAREIIDRQQREIKEYKLFIKQMMDRE